MTTLRLHNSLTRRVEDFVPEDPRPGDAVCLRTDRLQLRSYRQCAAVRRVRPARAAAAAPYPGVVYARNITDVDDKINAAAIAAGVPIDRITDRFAAAFFEDMAALGVDAPDVTPHATAAHRRRSSRCASG